MVPLYIPGMKTLRVYLDTSVLGGCFDPEFAAWSNGLIADLRSGTFRSVLSDLLAAEVRGAPAPIVRCCSRRG